MHVIFPLNGNEKIMGNQLSKSEIKDWQSFMALQTNSGSPATQEGRIYSFLDGQSQAIVTAQLPAPQRE